MSNYSTRKLKQKETTHGMCGNCGYIGDTAVYHDEALDPIYLRKRLCNDCVENWNKNQEE